MHTKLWVVDQKHLYLGSANMDWRSLSQVGMEIRALAADSPRNAKHKQLACSEAAAACLGLLWIRHVAELKRTIILDSSLLRR